MFGQVPPAVDRGRGDYATVLCDMVRLSALAAMVVFGCGAAADAPVCALRAGGRVMLASDAVDPDVFLWDSRERLVDYTAGQWGNTRSIFSHTLLTEPGTFALVVACIPKAAHPRYAIGDEDAVGVRLMSGPNRGRYGWVLSTDAHPDRSPAGQSASAPRHRSN